MLYLLSVIRVRWLFKIGGDSFDLGDLTFEVIETPGHTYESISITVTDRSSGRAPIAVFSGDTLFSGDVGRTDFFPDKTEEVAGLLYHSIFEKLLPLGDHVILLPAHGAGSVCGFCAVLFLKFR